MSRHVVQHESGGFYTFLGKERHVDRRNAFDYRNPEVAKKVAKNLSKLGRGAYAAAELDRPKRGRSSLHAQDLAQFSYHVD